MIVLPIHKSTDDDDDDDTPQEWSMLELNGEVVPPNSISNNSNNMELGSIKLDEKGENATMIIASHELKGKLETLKQPFVVMRPCKRPRSGNLHGESMDTNENEFNRNGNKKVKTGYEIAGIVRAKILFDHYPKSIMR